MRRLVLSWLLLVPVAAFAASGDDFYQRLYQRGMAHFAAGEYAGAYTDLRRAAFGFVEQVDTFETAHAYIAIAAHRLGRDNEARESLMRIVGAEKVQPHFRSVKLPDALRAEIDTLAATLLTTQESALLGVSAQSQDAASAPKQVAPAPTNTDTAPHDADLQPAPVPQPVTPAPQPQTPKPIVETPQPQPIAPVPKPKAPAAQPQPIAPDLKPKVPTPQPSQNAGGKLSEAQKAIDDGDIGRARSIYNALLNNSPLAHEQAIRLAEGLYKTHDFAGAVRAFQLVGAFVQGEEPNRYDYAVALYETGHYKDAKRELAAALPYVPITPDVTRNRAKIEGAIE